MKVLVVGGGGRESVDATASGAGNSFYAGSGAMQVAGGAGSDLFVVSAGQSTLTGGGGANLYSAVAGSAGGSAVITDFTQGVDHLALRGYGSTASVLAQASVSGGATTLSLGDGTRLVLQGVMHLGMQSFA